MSQAKGTSLSLRPFPISDSKPKSLADFISRVNAQPGGFRELSEDKLAEEAAQERARRNELDGQDVEMSDGEDGDDEDGPGDSGDGQDLIQSRIEVLQNIDIASNTAMLTLDSLSLLLSKQNPTQAGLTLSKHLRDIVGIGTLGADRLEDSNLTQAKEKDQEEVAQGLTIMEINNTRESALAATEFLEKEVELEGKYWEEIIGVQKSGWALCKMTQDKRMLGVRFGFSEAAPDFRNLGLAPLKRAEDGSVNLDCGQLGNVSERLIVTYEKDGQVAGRTAVGAQTTDNATIEGQVLEARNALFSKELWHELTRESRTLAAYDVRAQDSRLQISLQTGGSIILELLTVDSLPSSDELLPENSVTEAISLALQVMLSHTHKTTELMRTRPMPPHISRPRTNQHVYTLLRPILAHISHFESTRECTQYVGAIVQALKKAGLPSSFTLSTALPSLATSAAAGQSQLSDSQLLVNNLSQPREFHLELTIVPGMAFTVRGRTFLYPFMGTIYHIVLPPESPLESVCPPYKDGFPDVATLKDSLRTSVSKILAEHFISTLSQDTWTTGMKGTSIIDAEKENSELDFAIKEDDAKAPHLVVTYNLAKGGGRQISRTWTWRSTGDSELRTLSNLVEDFGKRSIELVDS